MDANGSARRTAEAAAWIMIGDGVIGLLRPVEHCLIWQAGPRWWRETVEWFAERPQLTRAAAAIEVATGLWLAFLSQRALPEIADSAH
jgi:hypothetical protein